jgi:hypothetical protein
LDSNISNDFLGNIRNVGELDYSAVSRLVIMVLDMDKFFKFKREIFEGAAFDRELYSFLRNFYTDENINDICEKYSLKKDFDY